MIREWPKNLNSETITVRWQKGIFPIIVTGIFSVLMSIVIPIVIWARLNNKLPEEMGTLSFIFLITMLLLFTFAAIGGLISSVKNYTNPSIRFIANREGIFMNITFKQREAFFASWHDIEEIKKIEVKMGTGKERYRDIAVGIFLSESSSMNLPKVLRGVIGSGKNYIAFAKGTMDIDLYEIMEKLNCMKKMGK